jgi:hypothetical protein
MSWTWLVNSSPLLFGAVLLVAFFVICFRRGCWPKEEAVLSVISLAGGVIIALQLAYSALDGRADHAAASLGGAAMFGYVSARGLYKQFSKLRKPRTRAKKATAVRTQPAPSAPPNAGAEAAPASPPS